MEQGTEENYSRLTSRELMDIYINTNKELEPEKAKALEEALRSKVNDNKVSAGLSSAGVSWKEKNIWLPVIAAVLIIASILMPYLMPYFYTPESSSMFMYSLINLGLVVSVISILLFAAFKGSIIAGIILALYFIYFLFGRSIF